MAFLATMFSKIFVPKHPRPLNVAQADETLIFPTSTMARMLGCFPPTSTREIGSPRTLQNFYPTQVFDARLVGMSCGTMSWGPTSWSVRPGVPFVHMAIHPNVGYNLSPNYGNWISRGNVVDPSSSAVANGPAYTAILGNWAGGNILDRDGNNVVGGFSCSPVQGNRIIANAIVSNEVGTAAETKSGNSPTKWNGADLVGDKGGDDSVSRRKVKLLCSYGGKIMPRPSDGTLRYVGGQARIVTVKRDVSFKELKQKMVDTCGQCVVIKYQLPEEDLDVLVSVSCPDDLENMMYEYERLTERSSDGSAKLRIFLFSTSEIDALDGVLLDPNDNGQRYIAAVNGTIDGVSCQLIRKGSLTGAALTQNSEVNVLEALDGSTSGLGDVSVMPSSCVIPHRDNVLSSHDTNAKLMVAHQSPKAYSDASVSLVSMPVAMSGPAQTSAFQSEVELGKFVPLTLQQQRFGVRQSGMDISPPAPFVHLFVDSHQEVINHENYVQLPVQARFQNSQLLGMHRLTFTQQTAPHENWVKQDVLMNKPVYSDTIPAQESPNEHTNEFVNLVSQSMECSQIAQTPIWDIPRSNAQSKLGNHLTDYNLPSLISPSVRFGANSLFNDQDPWNIHHITYFPPPRPKKVPSKKEMYSTKDNVGEQFTGDSRGQNLEAQLEDSPYQSLKQSLHIEHGYSTRGSTEGRIEQHLQALTETVAAFVLQSSTPSADLHGRDVSSQHVDDLNRDKALDVKSKLQEKPNLGIPSSDGLGGLQIIKNCDLEELRKLGSGASGAVYHGRWRGSDVAIKRIHDRCLAGKPSEQEQTRTDFWNEAIKLADSHHPNVVEFYGVVLDGSGGSMAIVTEIMVNGSLRDALQQSERNFDKRKRLLIAMDVAFGMEYLHGKNIVHFDLKSDNLLVNLTDPHRPICKVGDLGLSKVKSQTLTSGGVRGTLPWMAPELLNGSSLVSEKVDVFSFGIVMWEILTGEEPYDDLSDGAIIGGIVNNTLRPSIPDSCDLEWKLLMERCWSFEPSERPSFTEIANELRFMESKIPPKGQA